LEFTVIEVKLAVPFDLKRYIIHPELLPYHDYASHLAQQVANGYCYIEVSDELVITGLLTSRRVYVNDLDRDVLLRPDMARLVGSNDLEERNKNLVEAITVDYSDAFAVIVASVFNRSNNKVA
jgi:hypothetical protein